MDDLEGSSGRSTEQRYSSFLIRCWRRSGHDWRIKVEHIQSQESTHVSTHAAALAWIEERCSTATHEVPSTRKD